MFCWPRRISTLTAIATCYGRMGGGPYNAENARIAPIKCYPLGIADAGKNLTRPTVGILCYAAGEYVQTRRTPHPRQGAWVCVVVCVFVCVFVCVGGGVYRGVDVLR